MVVSGSSPGRTPQDILIQEMTYVQISQRLQVASLHQGGRVSNRYSVIYFRRSVSTPSQSCFKIDAQIERRDICIVYVSVWRYISDGLRVWASDISARSPILTLFFVSLTVLVVFMSMRWPESAC